MRKKNQCLHGLVALFLLAKFALISPVFPSQFLQLRGCPIIPYPLGVFAGAVITGAIWFPTVLILGVCGAKDL